MDKIQQYNSYLTGGEAVHLIVSAPSPPSEHDHFRKSSVYHRPTIAILGAVHIMISVIITALGEYHYWWFRSR